MLLAFIKSIEPKLKKHSFCCLYLFLVCLFSHPSFISPSDITESLVLLLTLHFFCLGYFYLFIFFISLFHSFSFPFFLFHLFHFYFFSFHFWAFLLLLFQFFSFLLFSLIFFHFFSSSFLLFICSLFLYVYIKPGSWINIREGLKNS